MNKLVRKLNKCKRCGWTWIGRKEISHRCPKCFCYDWDKDEPIDNRLLSKMDNANYGKEEKTFTKEEVEEVIKSVLQKISE